MFFSHLGLYFFTLIYVSNSGNTILVRYVGQTFRMLGSLIGIMIAFAPSIAVIKLNTDTWQLEFFVLTLVNLIVLKLLTGVLQSGLLGLAATLPHRYTEAGSFHFYLLDAICQLFWSYFIICH